MPRKAGLIPEKSLPHTYVITADGPADVVWWRRFRAVLDRDHQLIQLRLKSLPDVELRNVIARAAELVQGRGCRLLLNGPQEFVSEFGLAGLHLTTSKLMSLTDRPLPSGLLVGASCHNVEELRQAELVGADFACIAPVLHTASHPGLKPVGMAKFREWAGQSRLPVYALGGMGQRDIGADIDEVRRAGGHGIAGISAFWK